MMIQAVLLYGSKARRDHIGESDTDLLGISAAGKIEKIYEDHGVSFHVYPFPWMSENALRGSLFLLHIARESIALFDPRDMLGEIKTRFRYKESYREEIQVGARILIAVDDLTMDGFSDRIRSRFFWGLRTAIMALAADKRTPLFSAESLEKFLKVEGLALLIRSRESATLDECKTIGRQVIGRLGSLAKPLLAEDRSENLRMLFGSGGVGAATAGEINYGI